MAKFPGTKHVLLDIEGTICSISFVKETLFPYALKALPTVLARDWDTPTFQPYRAAFPPEHSTDPATLQAHAEDLTRRDIKIAYHKNLQGYLWEAGYKSGEYSTPLFPDVAPKLKAWKGDGLELGIYSSGSVFAQKLLFEHVAKKAVRGGADDGVEVEDLRGLIGAWFDTVNAGLKMEKGSYEKIAEVQKWSPDEVLFLSDNVLEVKAAREAGMKVCLLERDGNAPLTKEDRESYPVVQSLDQIDLATVRRSARIDAKRSQ